MSPDPLDPLRAARRDVAAIMADFRAAWEHAGDDGAAEVHVRRRRADARGVARGKLTVLDEGCRLAAAQTRPAIEEEIRRRQWVADDAKRDWDVDEEGRRIRIVASWSVMKRRINEAREPEACIALLVKMAREYARASDDDGLAILTHEVPSYLRNYRGWPPGRVASATAAIQEAERAAWKDPPEWRLGSLDRLLAEVEEVVREARIELGAAGTG